MVIEIDAQRMKSGAMLVLSRVDLTTWTVARYSRADVEEWTKEFSDPAEAGRAFTRALEQDDGT